MAQAVGFLAMVAFASLTTGVVSTPAFAARTLDLHGARFTAASIVRSILDLDSSPNLFRIQTDRAARQLARLPAVLSASVQVRLPATVVVTLVERTPKIAWSIGSTRFAVDQDGVVFGYVDSAGNPVPSAAGPLPTPTEIPEVTETPAVESGASAGAEASSTESPTAEPTETPTPTPTETPTPTPKPGAKKTPTPKPTITPTPTIDPSVLPSIAAPPTPDPGAPAGSAALRVVFDRQASDANLKLGQVVDPVSLDAGYRLAGLTPADVGSQAEALAVVLDDDHGFTVSSIPAGWVAEFGFYAPTVRKTSIIPAQVRDLRSGLLQFGEDHVAWVRLVADVSDSHLNTYFRR
jgi:hypothetical protein